MSFITFEGIDQSGKSTQIEMLSRALINAGHDLVGVREPGGTPLGDQIRELLLGPQHEGMDIWAEALLYAAARAQLVGDIIKPALAAGKTVLSDRYVDSSLAYQGYARQLGIQRIMDLNMAATGGLLPDLTLILHLDVDSSRGRLLGSGATRDRIESEPLDFHKRVEDGYHKLEDLYPERIVGLAGGESVKDVHRRIIEVCRRKLGWELEEVEG